MLVWASGLDVMILASLPADPLLNINNFHNFIQDRPMHICS